MLHEIPYPAEALDVVLKGEPSATSPSEIRLMLWMLKSCPPGNILEIGTFHGATALEFATAFPERKVICVDKLLDGYGLTANESCRLAKHLPNVELRLQDSSAFVYEEKDDISFSFVDGDHSYVGIKTDTELLLPWFKSHPGLVFWHDFHKNETSDRVFRYIMELALQMDIYHVESTMLAYARF